MKKLILLLSIITIGYSCQKQTIEPTVQNNVQQSTCGPLGDCFSGTYVFDSILSSNVPNNPYQDTVCNGLICIISYEGDTIINGGNYIKYNADAAFNSTPFLSQGSITNLNAMIRNKNDAYNNVFALQTKTNKVLVFKKI